MDITLLTRKTILVTGGCGFLGSNLCEKLLSLGAFVVCVDDFSQGKAANVAGLMTHPNFECIESDCNVRKSITPIFKKHKIDYVFHYAATVGVKRTIENPLAVLEDGEGIRNIFMLSHENKD